MPPDSHLALLQVQSRVSDLRAAAGVKTPLRSCGKQSGCCCRSLGVLVLLQGHLSGVVGPGVLQEFWEAACPTQSVHLAHRGQTAFESHNAGSLPVLQVPS